MPAPSADQIVDNPPPLNPRRAFPFGIDEFPADLIYGVLGRLAGTAPNSAPAPVLASPNRKEAR